LRYAIIAVTKMLMTCHTLAEIGLLLGELPAPPGELAGVCPGADGTLLLGG
jgi:hypothetical protein